MNKKFFFSVGIGFMAGFLMSIVVLYMLITSMNQFKDMMYVIAIVAGCALPECLLVFRKQEGLAIYIAQVMMIVTSFLITLIYGTYISNATLIQSSGINIFAQVIVLSGILHGASLILCSVIQGIHTYKTRKSLYDRSKK